MNREKFEKLMGLVFEVNTRTGNVIEFSHNSRDTLKLTVVDYEVGKVTHVTLGLDYTLIDEDYDYMINTCDKMLEESEVPV